MASSKTSNANADAAERFPTGRAITGLTLLVVYVVGCMLFDPNVDALGLYKGPGGDVLTGVFAVALLVALVVSGMLLAKVVGPLGTSLSAWMEQNMAELTEQAAEQAKNNRR